MKNIFTLLIITILSGSILFANSKENKWIPVKNDKNPIDFTIDMFGKSTFEKNPEIKKEWKPYMYDSGLYEIALRLYPDNRLLLTKSINTGKTKRDLYLTTYNTVDIYYKIYDKIDKISRTSPIIKTGTIDDRFYLCLYDISQYGGDDLLIVKEKDKIIWYGSPLLTDIKEIDKDTYMIHNMCTVYYVHILADQQIIETYNLPFGYMNSSHTGIRDPYPISGTILTDNIVRLQYANGAIEHWKVKLSEKDIESNLNMTKNLGLSESKAESYADNALIWWNGIGKSSIFIHYEEEKSWDYNDNPKREPVYDNML